MSCKITEIYLFPIPLTISYNFHSQETFFRMSVLLNNQLKTKTCKTEKNNKKELFFVYSITTGKC